jgi:pimeloyl-ACP methyl ester carboxylesterase
MPQILASEIAAAIGSRWTGRHVWGGHSWGAKLALLAAASDPSRAAGIVLFDPVRMSTDPMTDPAAVADYLFSRELKTWRTVDEAIEAVRPLPAYRSWTPSMEQALRRGLTLKKDGHITPVLTRERAIEILRATFATDAAATVEDIKIPILLIVAEDSRRYQASNIALLWRATQVFVSGNHWVHVNSIDEVAAALSKWLSQHGL